jgi:hypothetical protein
MNVTQFEEFLDLPLFGTFLDCYLLVTLKSRPNAFAIIMALFVISILIVELVSDSTGSRYVLCVLCVTGGALVHWTQKLGYTCSAMTGNMFKIAEYIFMIANGMDLGGPKINGEVVILVCIFSGALIGVLLAVASLQLNEAISLFPLLFTIPLHLHYAGCYKEWGWVAHHNPSSSLAATSKPHDAVELSTMTSPLPSPATADCVTPHPPPMTTQQTSKPIPTLSRRVQMLPPR